MTASTAYKSSFLLFLFLCLALLLYAQKQMNLNDLKENSIYSLREIAWLKTETALSVDSVSKRNDFYVHDGKAGLSLGFMSELVWLRFRIKNPDSQPRKIYMAIGDFLIFKMELFQRDSNGSFRSLGIMGRNFPVASRVYKSNYFIYPIDLPANTDMEYYFYIDSRGVSLQFMLLLMSEDTLHRQENILLYTFGVFMGILLLSAIFHLFLFIYNREKIHMLYTVYSVMVTLLILCYEGFDHLVFFSSYPIYNSRSLTCLLTLFLQLWLMQVYLNLNKNNTRFFHALQWMKGLCLLLSVTGTFIGHYRDHLPLFFQKAYFYCFALFTLAGFILILATSIEQIRKGNKLAWFYLSAVCTMLVGGSIGSGGVILGYFYLTMPPNILEISLLLETLIICFGILYRYILYRREKEKLSLELQRQQQENSDKLIFVQEEERKRIASDLHDEIGGELALMKLYLQKLQVPEVPELLKMLDKTASASRQIAHDLMPPDFENTSLPGLLGSQVGNIGKLGKIDIQFFSSGQYPPLLANYSLMIYRIYMELISNILRHAMASEATIQLICEEEMLLLMAEDNGRGIPKDVQLGLGLNNIRTRIKYLEGNLNIDSHENGTTIIIQIPVKPFMLNDKNNYS